MFSGNEGNTGIFELHKKKKRLNFSLAYLYGFCTFGSYPLIFLVTGDEGEPTLSPFHVWGKFL